MSKYKTYQNYEDSGIEWIGQVPEGWKVVPLKFVADIVNGATPDSSNPEYWEGDIPWYTPTDIDNVAALELGPPRRFISQAGYESCGVKLTPPSSVILSTRAPIGSVGITTIASTINQGCRTLIPRGGMPTGFLASTLVAARDELRFRGNGTTFQELSTEGLRSLRVPLPPKNEFDSISAKLNRENTLIESLIAKKVRFLEIIKEKRQAFITNIVTKGLKPNQLMKESEIEWIGTIPKHWKIKPFFALLSELNRKNIGLFETNILSLSYGRIVKKPDNRNMGLVPESYETYQIVEPGDVVFRFTDLQNDKRSLRSAEVTERGIITSAYMAVRPHSIQSTYFAWLMRSYDLCKVFYGLGGGIRQSLKFEDVKRLPIVVPPIEEQIEISKFIGQQLILIDTLIEKTQRSIDLLKERRIAFITAAVTGKIDLRNKQETIS